MSRPRAHRAPVHVPTVVACAAVLASLLTLAGCPAPSAKHPSSGAMDSNDPVDPSAACPPGSEREGGPYDGCPDADAGSR